MKTVAIAAVAAAVAVALIVAAVYIPGSNILGGRSSTESTTSGTSSGSFSVMMTDPPTVPANVTDVYMTYDKVGVHISGDSNNSGWQILSSTGTIDLMQEINVSQTIATANLQAGETFNALGFNITQVLVTYVSALGPSNYTAQLVYGNTRFFVPIPGGITISSSGSQAVMIDMTPRIIMLGNSSQISFAFLPSARGYVVPSAEVPAQSHMFIGARMNLSTNPWWKSILENTSFAVSSVVAAQNGLNITVTNTGSTSIVFHFAAVTSENSQNGGYLPAPAVSDIFVVESNATLAQLNTSSSAAAETQVEGSGYLLAPGQSVSFIYSGSVAIGLQSQYALQLSHPLVAGHTYIVRLFGNGFVAAAGTTAIQSMTG
jgi:hypothetical protein